MIQYWFARLLVPFTAIAFSVFFGLTVLSWARREKGRSGCAKAADRAKVSVLVGYLAGIFSITLDIPELIRNGIVWGGDFNSKPFMQIAGYLGALNSENTLVNLWGNILIFIPLGVFVPAVKKSKTSLIGTAVLSAFAVSLFIELFQMMTPRVSDIDDILLNVVGGMMGGVLYRAALSLKRQAVSRGNQ